MNYIIFDEIPINIKNCNQKNKGNIPTKLTKENKNLYDKEKDKN